MTTSEFTLKQTELLKNIPKEFKGELSYLAYESGHSYGNEEILNHLQTLVSALEPCIEKFRDRVCETAIQQQIANQ